MRYLSTFSGIGGFELGIEQAYVDSTDRAKNGRGKSVATKGNRKGDEAHEDARTSHRRPRQHSDLVRPGQEPPACVGYSEIDRHAIEIYQRRFPNHKNYGDIRAINPKKLPDFDLLVGGFPCQAFSIAGKRKGFKDTRGTLFFEIARIVRAKRPRLLLLENVKGLLSHDNGKTFYTIVAALDDLGYDIQWQVLNSKNFGVPQNRERVFIVGHLRGTPRPAVFPIEAHGPEAPRIQRPVTNTLTARYEATATGSYVAEDKLDAQKIKRLNNPRHSTHRVYGAEGISPTLNTMQGGGRQPYVKVPEATKRGYAKARKGDSINLSVPNSKTRRGRVGKGIAQTLDTGMQQYTLHDMEVCRLTPLECERLQGFPDDWTEGVSDTQRYKCIGNAVTVNVVKEIIKRLWQK